MKTLTLILACVLSLIVSIFGQETASKEHPEFGDYYDHFGVTGSFALYDSKNETYHFYNRSQFETPYTPASTFKICHSLIGLETGVIPDENYVIPWDSVERNPIWDKDYDLKNAYKNSAVWYYQELAKRVGSDRMKEWLDKANYGNTDISGGIHLFWLTGELRVTPQQQIEFLQRLHDNDLPFSQRSMDIVKEIMRDKDYQDFDIRAKTGWGGQGENEIGWYIGYVQAEDNVYYFANCVQAPGKDIEEGERAVAFDKSRKEITYQILKELIE